MSFWAPASKAAARDSEDNGRLNVVGHPMMSGIDVQVAQSTDDVATWGRGSVLETQAAGNVCGQHLFYYLSADQGIWENKTK